MIRSTRLHTQDNYQKMVSTMQYWTCDDLAYLYCMCNCHNTLCAYQQLILVTTYTQHYRSQVMSTFA